MDIFDRRHTMAMLGGAIGMTASSCAAHGAVSGGGASPINPKLVYSFRPRGLERGTYGSGLSFSRSGRYLAVVSGAATYEGPSLSVWDIVDRKLKFRTNDLKILANGEPHSRILWGIDDAWIALDAPNSDGDVNYLDINSGRVVKSIRTMSERVLLNNSATKLLVNKGSQDFQEPKVYIIDLKTGVEKPVSVVNCAHGRQAIPRLYQWTADDRILWISLGAMSAGPGCSTEDVSLAREASTDLFNNYYIMVIDPEGRVPRVVKNFRGSLPWSDQPEVNFASNKISLQGTDILDLTTMVITSIPAAKADKFVGSSSAFSPDGRLLYLSAFDPRVKSKGLIIDTASGEKVGEFPGAKQDDEVVISPDGKWLAFARDFDVEIYRLS